MTTTRWPINEQFHQQYDTHESLGTGQFAKVVRVTRQAQSFALKFTRTTNSTIIERLNDEVECLRILSAVDDDASHFVAALHDSFRMPLDSTIYALVCDLVPGKTLAEWIDEDGRAPPPPEQARQLVLSAARAMAYVHRHDVAHRDVKPDNIMITADDRLVLIDFGFACTRQRCLEIGTVNIPGAPEYVSPEVALLLLAGDQSERGDDVLFAKLQASDVYALGISMFEMLTGRAPPMAELLDDFFAASVTDRAWFWRKIASGSAFGDGPIYSDSAAVDSTVKRMLTTDYTKRCLTTANNELQLPILQP